MHEEIETRVGTILTGTASGLVPMAIFTPVYAIWPVLAWGVPGLVFFVAAVAWSVHLARSAARLVRLGRELPHATGAVDARITRGMTIVGSIQGGLILTSVVVLGLLGRWEWVLPAVVLVVALHFYPMPAIFGRTIDYYLGTAMLVVAGIGLYLASLPNVPWQTTWGVVGIGAALVTSGYGLWMQLTARRVLTEYQEIGGRPGLVTPTHR